MNLLIELGGYYRLNIYILHFNEIIYHHANNKMLDYNNMSYKKYSSLTKSRTEYDGTDLISYIKAFKFIKLN